MDQTVAPDPRTARRERTARAAEERRVGRRLRAFAAEHVEDLRPHRWHASSPDTRVLELRGRDGSVHFVKQLELGRKWRREVAAYDAWSPLLGPRMPRLVAHCPQRRTLLVTGLEGRAAAPLERSAYRPAGALLAAVHGLPVPGTEPTAVGVGVGGAVGGTGEPREAAAAWAAWCARVEARAEDELDRVLRRGLPVDAAVVRRAVAELAALDPQPLVSCHGDFLPKNWVVGGPELRLIDFADAGARPVAAAFSRLHVRTLWHRPDLFAQLLRGYGRPLQPEELRLVSLLRAVDAVALQRWGAHRGAAGAVARGHEVLAAVARDAPVPTSAGWTRRLAPRVPRGRSGVPAR